MIVALLLVDAGVELELGVGVELAEAAACTVVVAPGEAAVAVVEDDA